jgi:hypothetical protein
MLETSGCGLIFINFQIKLQYYSRIHDTNEARKIDCEFKKFIENALPNFIYTNEIAIKEFETKIANMINGPFYEQVTKEEKDIIFRAMNAEFQGNRHWYTCPNGHIVLMI